MIFDKAKSIRKEYACMEFHDETKSLYIGTGASGVGLGAGLLQKRSSASCLRDEAPDNSILRPIVFVSKSLSNTEKRYRNIERGVLGILYRLKKFHHYCFAREVSIITDHKPPVAIVKKGITTLSQRLQ